MNKAFNIITTILFLIVCLLIIQLCERPRVIEVLSKPNVIKQTDSIIVTLHDTVTKYRTRYKHKVDTIYKIAPSICDTFINVIVQECDKLDSANTVLINTYKIQVNNYIKQDSLKTDTIKKLKRKSKINLFKGGVIGFGIGYLTGKVI